MQLAFSSDLGGLVLGLYGVTIAAAVMELRSTESRQVIIGIFHVKWYLGRYFM